MPNYIIPQRRNQTITPSREIVQGTTTELSSNYGSAPSSGAEYTPGVPELTDTSVSSPVDTDVSQSSPAAMPEPPHNAPEPMRSNRGRVPPDRYGEWVSNKHTVMHPAATQIWYV